MGTERGVRVRGTADRIRTAIPRFSLLLPLILLSMVVSGFQDHHPLVKDIDRWIKAAVLVLTLYVSGVGRGYFLSVAVLALASAAAWRTAQVHPGWPVYIVVLTVGALMVLAPVAILRRVWRDFAAEEGDSEIVSGALCAYLYIGAWFAFLYRAAAILSERPFFAQPGAEDGLNYLYFSLVTLTTVGYGGLFPANAPGRMLAATEAVVGQLYLVSVVAIVVSAYGKRRSGRP